jgi:hypothetical protein
MQAALVDQLQQQALTGREIAVILKVTPGRISQIKSGRGPGGRVDGGRGRGPAPDGPERQTA